MNEMRIPINPKHGAIVSMIIHPEIETMHKVLASEVPGAKIKDEDGGCGAAVVSTVETLTRTNVKIHFYDEDGNGYKSIKAGKMIHECIHAALAIMRQQEGIPLEGNLVINPNEETGKEETLCYLAEEIFESICREVEKKKAGEEPKTIPSKGRKKAVPKKEGKVVAKKKR